MASKIKNLLKKVKSKASSAQKYVPGATLNKPTLPSLKSLGVSGSSLTGSAFRGLNGTTKVDYATAAQSLSSKTPLPRNYSSVPYNPNVPNMSVVPKAATTKYQTLNRLEGQMQTPNPDYGVYQTQAPKTSYSGGNTATQPVQPTGPVSYNRNYSSSNNTVGSSSAPAGSASPISRSSVSSSPSISGSPTISPAGVTTPAGATTGGTLNTPDGATNQYDYSLTPEERALEEARKRETEYYDKLSNERISRDEIMRDTLAQFQGEIDATNSVFADKLRSAQVQGQNRLGMTRAENFNAGIQNSSFASAAQDRTANFNMDAENAIQNEKLQMLSQIEGAAREAGQRYYEQKKAAKEAGLESYMAALTGAKSAKEAIATDIADGIMNSNLTIEEISNESLNKIAKEAGVTTVQIKKFYKQREEELAQLAEEEAKKGQFNLSEGQARYDAQGNLIASRAKTYAPKAGAGSSEVGGGVLSSFPPDIQAAAQSILDGKSKLNEYPSAKRLQINAAMSQVYNAEGGNDLAQGAYDAIVNLETNPGFRSGVGAKGLSSLFGLKGQPIAGTNAAGFISELDKLKANLKLVNIKYLKGTGALSDAEGKTLEDASTSLNTSLPERQFKDELARVKAALIKANNVTQSNAPSTTNGTIVTAPDGQEIEIID